MIYEIQWTITSTNLLPDQSFHSKGDGNGQVWDGEPLPNPRAKRGKLAIQT